MIIVFSKITNKGAAKLLDIGSFNLQNHTHAKVWLIVLKNNNMWTLWLNWVEDEEVVKV